MQNFQWPTAVLTRSLALKKKKGGVSSQELTLHASATQASSNPAAAFLGPNNTCLPPNNTACLNDVHGASRTNKQPAESRVFVVTWTGRCLRSDLFASNAHRASAMAAA